MAQYLCFIALLATWALCSGVSLDGKTVYVRHAFPELQRRSDDYDSAPEETRHLPLHIRTLDGHVTGLFLQLNDKIDRDIKITFDKKELNEREQPSIPQNVAYYQDPKKAAAMSVTREHDHYKLHGTFAHDGHLYNIEPSSEPGRRDVSEEGHAHSLREVSLNFGQNDMGIAKSDNALRNAIKIMKRADDVKRANNGPYHVETMFLCDHSIYNSFMKNAGNNHDEAVRKIKTYYSHQINGLDMSYRTLQGIEVWVWLTHFYVSTSSSGSGWTQGQLSGDNLSPGVVWKTGKWLNSNGYGPPGDNNGNPDHTMIWTRFNINGLMGYAPYACICSEENSNSLSRDEGFHAWLSASHELGHNLGSEHDGDNGCRQDDDFIMHPQIQVSDESKMNNFMKFSSCSISQIRKVLTGKYTDNWGNTKPAATCLANPVCNHGSDYDTQTATQMPGSTLDVDQQCALTWGKGSKRCNLDWTSFDMCRDMWCSNPQTGACDGVVGGAAEGTPCKNGVCIANQCAQIGTTSSIRQYTGSCDAPPAGNNNPNNGNNNPNNGNNNPNNGNNNPNNGNNNPTNNNGGCEDIYTASQCAQYKVSHGCDHPTVAERCKATCGTCGSTNGGSNNPNPGNTNPGNPNCVDKYDHAACKEWAERQPSECDVNPDWMLPNCQKSCKQC